MNLETVFEMSVSIATITVSLIALIVSIRTMKVQSTFNKNSVRPYLSLNLVSLGDRISVEICNDGVGIALIQGAVFSDENHGFQSTGLLELIEKDKALPINRNRWKRYIEGYEIKKLAIGPGSKKVLLEIVKKDNPDWKENEIVTLKSILGASYVTIFYNDIYKTEFALKQSLDTL